MLTESAVKEFVGDVLQRLHPSIAAAAKDRIVARFGAIEHRVSLDSEHRDGLIRALLEVDAKSFPGDYKIVPLPSELLEAEVARQHALGIDLDPEAKLSAYRQLERLSEEQRIAKGEEFGIAAQGDVPAAPPAHKPLAPTDAPKRVVDMSESEVEALIASKFGAPPPTGRLGSEFRRYRDALIKAEQSGPDARDLREVEIAKALERQRELSPTARIAAYRAGKRVGM